MRLEARNVWFRYSPKNPWILENQSIHVDSGEVVGLVAPSGSGKSTLCRVLAGLLSVQKGEVLLDEKSLPKKGFCPVQLVFQHPEQAVNPSWRMKKVLREAGEPDEELFERFGLEKAWLDRFPAELSGGELQRFCLTRAFQKETKFLIADEISTMLDVVTQAQIWQAVLETAKDRGIGILAVTHNEALAERICTRLQRLEGDA